jgi:hypothetical protein
MSSFIKVFQIIVILLIIALIVSYNKFILNSLTNCMIFSTKGIYAPDEMFNNETNYDSDDLFNTEYHVTEDMGDAISDALKSVM